MSLTDDLYNTGFPGGMFNYRIRRHLARTAGGRRQARAAGRPDLRQGAHRARRHPLPGRTRRCTDRPRTSTPCSNEASHRVAFALHAEGARHLGEEGAGRRSSSPAPSRTSRPAANGRPSSATCPPTLTSWATIVNGTHADSLGPGTIARWLEFLDIFVADKVPAASPVLTTLAPSFYCRAGGRAVGAAAADAVLERSRTSRAARAAFEQQPRVRVLFDNGGGSAGPGALQPVWSEDFTSWPPASGTGDHAASRVRAGR